MSDNQEPKRGRGRPMSQELFVMPPEMAKALGPLGFFDGKTSRHALWPNLPIMDKIDRIYRFRAAMQRAIARTSIEAIEIALERSWKQISRYLRGDDIPLSVLENTAIIADLPGEWVTVGTTSLADSYIKSVADDDVLQRNSTKSGFQRRSAAVDENIRQHLVNAENNKLETPMPPSGDTFPVNLEDYAVVHRYDVRASAGNGAIVFDDQPASIWRVPREMLAGFTGNAHNLASIDVCGDSMEPTLRDGDPVIFERIDHVDRDGVFVLSIDNELFVKRMRRLPTAQGRVAINLLSDNPDYDAITLDHDAQKHMRIHGRVIWPITARRILRGD